MPAPDYETLYDYEGAIETAVKNLLTANSITAYRQRDSSSVATPFASVKLTVGAPTGHMGRLKNGDMRPDYFTGNLEIEANTNRTNNTSNHKTYVSKVRNLMHQYQEKLTKTELPYHSFHSLEESGSSQGVDPENDLDRTTINFAVQFGIRADAWPA